VQTDGKIAFGVYDTYQKIKDMVDRHDNAGLSKQLLSLN
jgi:hypothetical protein